MTDETHLTAEDLAVYIDNPRVAEGAARVEAHLAFCAGCRSDLIVTRALLAPRRGAWPVMLLAAAGVAAVLVLGTPSLRTVIRGPSTPDPERARPTPSSAPIAALAPADEALVPRDRLRFAWQSSGAEAQYRLTLTDSTGGPVWKTESADTTVVPLPGPVLTPGTAYFWFVDALLPDGRTRTSGTHRFTIAP